MDVPRKQAKQRKFLKRAVWTLVVVASVTAITFAMSRLKPAAPTVDRATVSIESVKRGTMVRQVRGLGTLVPDEIRSIGAIAEGRVERIVAKPGAVVTPDTVLFELSNPELEQSVFEAEAQLRSQEAELKSLRAQLGSQQLTQRSQVASAQSDYNQAKLQADANRELARQGLISGMTEKLSSLREQELKTRESIERERLTSIGESSGAQVEALKSKIENLRAVVELRHKQLSSLHVRAGMSGVLQAVAVEVGVRVTPGTNLARVADPSRLKAQVRIPEAQAKDVVIGQRATIELNNENLAGHVTRLDPAVQNGTVTVDISFDGGLPAGGRVDLSVNGTVEIQRIEDTLYVARPVYGQENAPIQLFRLTPDGTEAVRVKATAGRSSVATLEIREGLREGDKVIISDTSAWDGQDRIRLR